MNLEKIGNNVSILNVKGHKILISYQTPVALYNDTDGHVYKTAKFWSRTTSKQINAWLVGITAEEKPQEYFDSFLAEVA